MFNTFMAVLFFSVENKYQIAAIDALYKDTNYDICNNALQYEKQTKG